MRRKLLLVLGGLVVIGGVTAGFALVAGRKKPPPPPPIVQTPSPTPSRTPGLLRGGEQATALKAVNDYGGEGQVTRLIEPNHYQLKIEATLPDPAPGKFYQGWLVRKNSSSQFAVGKLVRKDDQFVVNLEQARDASAYNDVFVSLETTDDKQPETHVLEGSFGP